MDKNNRYLSLVKEFQGLLHRTLTEKELGILRNIVKKEKIISTKKEAT